MYSISITANQRLWSNGLLQAADYADPAGDQTAVEVFVVEAGSEKQLGVRMFGLRVDSKVNNLQHFDTILTTIYKKEDLDDSVEFKKICRDGQAAIIAQKNE